MDNSNALWKVILRWIAILPASVLGMQLTFVLLRIINILFASHYIDTSSWMGVLYTDIVSNLIAGVAFVYVGFKVAPSNQKIVAIVLAVLLLVISCLSLFFVNFITKEYYSNLGIICGNIGSIVCCVSIVKGEMDEILY
jgi:hypothetical protein